MDPVHSIIVSGAREHNLKNVSISLPRNKLIVFTGLSGSGKSSLAFNTIYAEGQRRYVESLSSYARQFLEKLKKPDVESIAGLTPTIAIEQRSGQATPRSTVATTTEIHDYLRVLFARVGVPLCPECGRTITAQSAEDVVKHISALEQGTKLQIFAPLVRGKKGEHQDIFRHIMKDGFTRVRVNGEIYPVEEAPALDKKKAHNVEAVIDRIVLRGEETISRLADSVEIALKTGGGVVNVLIDKPGSKPYEEMFSEKFSCPEHGSVLEELHPRIFSFNSPFGACPSCSGLGTLLIPDPDLIIPDQTLSLDDGAIQAWKRCGSGMMAFYPNSVRQLSKLFDVPLNVPWGKLPEAKREAMLNGGSLLSPAVSYEGIIPNLRRRFISTESDTQKNRIHEYMADHECGQCKGARLKPEVLAVKVGGQSIAEVSAMTIAEASAFFKNLELNEEKRIIAAEALKAVLERLSFMEDVGLNYLTLNRLTRSLSGGEAQRIRLAGQVGAKLSGVTYVLDEPTIGLHQRDNERLISTLRSLRGLGNTLLVVEHDEDVIRSSDYMVDIGPGAGEHGGQVVATGPYEEFIKSDSITAKYLRGDLKIETPKNRRRAMASHRLSIKGCTENNLKGVDADFPLGLFICVTGVSGSGKSTLVNECLLKGLKRAVSNARVVPGKFKSLKGVELINKVIDIDQSPIGRTPRSNPATYIGVFDEIRSLFAMSPEAKVRGYTAGRFSFNVKGGRCEACQGQGQKTIEMHFLPDVYVTCESCQGTRYNKETLHVKYKGMTIAQVLEMPVETACEFFAHHPKIFAGLKTLLDTGLGYIRLGQPSTTLSGGEAQRIKLAAELSRSATGKTFYVMDEPSTGLHFHDIAKLIGVIQRLADAGNTLVVIEHNLDIIKSADFIIDLGPEGGGGGGEICVAGTPEQVSKSKTGHTARYLKKILA